MHRQVSNFAAAGSNERKIAIETGISVLACFQFLNPCQMSAVN